MLWNSNDVAVLTGRTMDWPESNQPLVVGFPQGAVVAVPTGPGGHRRRSAAADGRHPGAEDLGPRE
ncbi:hypothetical protein [Mycolicibacterium sarraceniae]|uniref:hypothetical protein n=1 Tax=Mycolicibacterium sarraceniae TaxID=1534348 RepID=UPI001F257D9C|nr:hypothetical protein [Mycolicibacterium sarraceniae]